jgi:hypothetical protein
MDHETDNKEPSSTEGGKVKWSDETRGGFWVRGVEPIDRQGEYCDLRGQVGNHIIFPPSDDPTDWTWETWRSDGRYTDKESIFDLIEVQGE